MVNFSDSQENEDFYNMIKCLHDITDCKNKEINNLKNIIINYEKRIKLLENSIQEIKLEKTNYQDDGK